MPDQRSERGPHPRDAGCFAPEEVPTLRTAVAELSWLLSRGYPRTASLKLVGDRHTLRDRQRRALERCAAGDEECRRRSERRIEPAAVRGETVVLDGYNVLLTIEAALSGGVLLLARDGALRDLASLTAHYKRVRTTLPALEAIGAYLAELGCARALWYLDRPISNSARLKGITERLAGERDWPWTVELQANTDRELIRSPAIVATADSAVLERCGRWLNLARLVVDRLPGIHLFDLSESVR